MDNKENFKIANKETKELFDSTLYFVSSTEFEQEIILDTFINKYGKENHSVCKENVPMYVGNVNNRRNLPVYLNLNFHKFFNTMVCFYEPISRFIDTKIITDWFDKNYDGDIHLLDSATLKRNISRLK